jgi:hypothetical protein
MDRDALNALNTCINFGKRGPGGKDAAVVQDKELQKFAKDVLANPATAKEYGTRCACLDSEHSVVASSCATTFLVAPPPPAIPPLPCRVQQAPFELSGTL